MTNYSKHYSSAKHIYLVLLFLLGNLFATNAQVDFAVGTGTSGNSGLSYPCPLQDNYEGSRAQYLYKASELLQLGFVAGDITAIKFNVTNLNLFSGDIPNLKIRIGSTNVAALSSLSWEVLNTPSVYDSVSYVPYMGVNVFTFSTPFYWDGSSNIIIEVCNGQPNISIDDYTENVTIPFTVGLPFVASHTYYKDDDGNLCDTANITQSIVTSTRPNLIFSLNLPNCTGSPLAGNAASNVVSACSNQPIILSTVGTTTGVGMQYRWEFATATGVWDTLPNATIIYFNTKQNATRQYRLKATCTLSNQSAYSNTIQVINDTLKGVGTYSACQNQIPFYFGGKKIDTAGVYNLKFLGSYGCDSLAKVTFSIIPSGDTTVSRDTICFTQFPYTKYGLIFNNIGTYYQKLYDGLATYFYAADTAVLNNRLAYLYKQMYAFGSGGYAGHDNFGQKAFDISNDLMGNDMVLHSQGYGWFNRDYQYITTLLSTNIARPDVVRRRLYDMLYTIKGMLEAIDATTKYTLQDKEKIKGQCYGLRAYCYYYLVNYYQQTYFGNTTLRGLPIIKENTPTSNNYASVQDIYNLIITDLTNAETLLTAKTFASKTAFSISVVYGFRARVALLMHNWTSAAYYANAAYKNLGTNTLMTAAQYKQGFNSIANPEWIWGSDLHLANITAYADFFAHIDGTHIYSYVPLGGQKKITKYLYDLIPVSDVRKQVFKTPGATTPVLPDYCQVKFKISSASNWVGDYVYMRTAEMYLIEAEAKARLGNDTGARAVLETLIKTRNNLYSAASFSDTNLIKEILLQRRIELWGEGFSLIDIKRTNAGLNRPTGTGNHGSPSFDPVVYTLPAGSPSMVWATPTRDSGLIIPCEKVEKLIITKKVIKETINKSVCTTQLPYNWNGNDYNTSGTYFYFGTTQNNSCDSACFLNLLIVNPPQISSVSYNSTLKSNDTLKLNVTATNATNYSWTGPNGYTATTQNPIIVNATSFNNGRYYVTALNDGCSTIDSIEVTVGKSFFISGRCITPKNILVKNASIKLLGSVPNTSLALNANGLYQTLVDSSMSANIVLKPSKNNDITKANGVSTADVVLTQRHILNLAKLNSAYKLIAADVTNDKIINSTDIIRMKRLILGLDTTFAGNRLWAFVDSAYQFADTTNPFPYKDSISFTNLTSNKTNQTFIGLKLGDVNYDWNATVARQSAANSQQSTALKLIAEVPNQIPNTQFQIPIKVSNFKQLNSFQYTLHFDNSKYEFLNLEGFKNLQGLEWNTSQANQTGNIAMLWTNAKGEETSLEDGTLLFELVLKPKEFGIRNWELELTLTNDITEIEAWGKNNQQHNIVLIQKIAQQTINNLAIEHWSVSPNPTKGDVVVTLSSSKNKTIIFELSNAQAKTLYTKSFEAVKGNNIFNLNLKQKYNLPTGLYFLKANGITQKLLIH